MMEIEDMRKSGSNIRRILFSKGSASPNPLLTPENGKPFGGENLPSAWQSTSILAYITPCVEY